MPLTIEERFWKQVRPREPDECWEWEGSVNGNGYAQITHLREGHRAHRVSWELHHGAIPRAGTSYHGICVLHRCDNRRCVNPAHLFLGSQADNMADAARKGRVRNNGAKGAEHPRARLTDEDVRQIRRLLSDGVSKAAIARLFGVDRSTVSLIARRKTWRHLDDEAANS